MARWASWGMALLSFLLGPAFSSAAPARPNGFQFGAPAGPSSVPSQGRSSWGRIGVSMTFDYSTTSSELPTIAPKTDWIWGGYAGAGPNTPNDWATYNPQIMDSRYFGISVDTRLGGNRDIAWYQANHPDWVLYNCDQNDNPTHEPAYQYGSGGCGASAPAPYTKSGCWGSATEAFVPIDIQNPAAVQFVVDAAMQYALQPAHKFQAMAADQIFLWNDMGAGPINSNYWGCGIWSGGTFIRRYHINASAPYFPNHDAQYATDMIAAVKVARDYLNAHGLKLIINHPPGSSANASEQALLGATDAILSEAGTAAHGNPSAGFFESTLAYMQYAQNHGVAFLASDILSNASPTATEIEWTLASYLIANEGNAYMYLCGSAQSGSWTWYPQYDDVDAKMGTPCAHGASSSNGVYYRRFTGGMVVINAATTTQSFALPAGHAYSDLYSGAVSSPLSVAPLQAYVLFTTNGCN